MNKSLIEAHREFRFAPSVVTVCGSTMHSIFEALGTQKTPVIRTTLKSHPFATYLPAAKIVDLKSDHLMLAGFADDAISATTPDIWMIGHSDGEKVLGLAPISAVRAQSVIAQMEQKGQTVLAFPIPKGAVN